MAVDERSVRGMGRLWRPYYGDGGAVDWPRGSATVAAGGVVYRWLEVLSAALLQIVGRVYQPRRNGPVGRKPMPRVVAPDSVYAQVVKVHFCRQTPTPAPNRSSGPPLRLSPNLHLL